MKILSIITALSFVLNPLAFAADQISLKDLSVKQIVLPSEVQKLPQFPGAVYYNKSVKGKVLIPVHIWGHISKPGLHFVPAETTFIQAVSMAGGFRPAAELDNVRLIRKNKENIKTLKFDISDGGTRDAYFYKMQPDDAIFVKRSSYNEDRNFYTSLGTLAISLISTFFVVSEIQRRN